MKKSSLIWDIILNILIFLMAFFAIAAFFTGGPDALGSFRMQCFRYFTTDSNVLAGITSLLFAIYTFKKLKNPDYKIPKAVFVLKFMGTTAVTVTLFTVLFFLAPMGMAKSGPATFFLYFAGNSLYLHLIVPVIAIINYLFLERDYKLNAKESLFGALPVVVYSVFYLTFVVALKQWPDFYGFTFGGNIKVVPISAGVMYLASYLFGFILNKLKK